MDTGLFKEPSSNSKCKSKGELQIGSVVLIKEDNIPHLRWPLGVVTQVYPGKDGFMRTVNVKTSNGVFIRSIQHLYDLEINNN